MMCVHPVDSESFSLHLAFVGSLLKSLVTVDERQHSCGWMSKSPPLSLPPDSVHVQPVQPSSFSAVIVNSVLPRQEGLSQSGDLVLVVIGVDNLSSAHWTVIHRHPRICHCHVGVPRAFGHPGVVRVLEARLGWNAARPRALLHRAQVRVRFTQHCLFGCKEHFEG